MIRPVVVIFHFCSLTSRSVAAGPILAARLVPSPRISPGSPDVTQVSLARTLSTGNKWNTTKFSIWTALASPLNRPARSRTNTSRVLETLHVTAACVDPCGQSGTGELSPAAGCINELADVRGDSHLVAGWQTLIPSSARSPRWCLLEREPGRNPGQRATLIRSRQQELTYENGPNRHFSSRYILNCVQTTRSSTEPILYTRITHIR